ncbi:hypothetical protein C7271_18265 [filamentous cyanobacterium CCP5]|nr:hypothetical protein C7271_18265 [filamentous cyanobacterium CCP5]
MVLAPAMATHLGQPNIIVISDRSGRLGNKLNLLAHFVAFSLEHDIPIMFPAFAPYGHLFEVTQGNPLCRIPHPPTEPNPAWLAKPLLSIGQLPVFSGLIPQTTSVFATHKRAYCDLSQPPSVQRLLSNQVVFAHGYFFRHFEGVRRHAAAIRQLLSPVQAYRTAAAALIEAARGRGTTVVGIHIRHGDYMGWQKGQHFFTLEQYRSIMASLPKVLRQRQLLYVVSSDAPWTREDFPGLQVTMADREPIIAMLCLSLCDYIVGPKSSFNRWASFYGNVPLYTIRDPEQAIHLADFDVNYLDDRQAIYYD